MTLKRIACALLALALAAPTLATAQGRHEERDNRSRPGQPGPHSQMQRGGHDQNDDRARLRERRMDPGRMLDRRMDQEQYRRDRARGPGFSNRDFDRRYGRNFDRHLNRGAGPGWAYHPGQRLPPQYRGRQYVVDDWRGHQLSAPPRGYQWVQSGSDYLLVAITTGLILQLLLAR